ncbi:efflux RND transporter permease subunit [Sulfurospirillum barnesii]|uniref:Hydrophobe/amphiphile efflux-1 (HAE1) family transporter n=1 Tax=Sulfurospirillum barnesii (strain ATCC 700032 / DSM 10660 / SES-3) TaxID=760154 RepID=I3Y0E5_SULBS|nr:multidrug efflux RND transporter permease subunit [Sulfurospirillum barnesii]AFL69669.1 hydrophobe/amphiphile efflux-1 (HAE1) family transporter [Sulfurospirillum barnesii SES-3]
MFSKFFIERPIFASVISLIILIAGIVSIRILPVQEYPNVVPPQIILSTTYPGADAKTLEETVASPLEQQLNGLENMIYMVSTTSPSGAFNIYLFFEVGTDIAQAKIDVNNRVQMASNKLPDAVKRQGVDVTEKSPDVLRVIALTSKENVHDTTYIANYAINNIIEEFKRIPGVADASIIGNKDYSIRIWIDPQKLSFYQITTMEVLSAIKNQNEKYPSGQIAQEPISQTASFTYTIASQGRLQKPEEFKEIILKANPDGSTLTLGDVATVELGSESYFFAGLFNGKPMSAIRIFLTSQANALDVSKQLDDKIAELSKNFPSDLQLDAAYDPTTFVRASIKEVIMTLLEAVVLVVLVVYLFLGNIRATIIPLLAIPVSIVGTFAGFYAMGFSINLLTLFGLTLAIGLVVDDAIIVIENVERILKQGEMNVKQATIKAMHEITGPVIAIVLVICAVFMPSVFSNSMSGVMSKQFAITLIISVSISGLIALTLTPALCALILKHETHKPFWFIQKFNHFFHALTERFGSIVQRTIRFSFITLLLFGVMLMATYFIWQKIPTGLIPKEDKGTFFAVSTLPPGASLSRTLAVNQEIASIALNNPLVAKVGGFSGTDFSSKAYKTDAGYSYIRLVDWSQRKDANQSLDAIAKTLTTQFSKNKEARIVAVTPPPIMGLSVTGGFELYIQNRTGTGYSALSHYAKEIVQKASQREELKAVRTTLNTNVPQYAISVDTKKAKAYNVEISDIYTTLQATFGNVYVNDFNLFGRTYKVNLQSTHLFREGVDNYSDVFVRSSDGNLIPISILATLTPIVNPSVTQRFNMFQAAQILGEPAAGYTSGEAMQIIENIAQEILPNGYTLEWGGASFQEKRLQKEGNNALIYAIVFVFLILAALYESWTIPFAVLFAIPFALFGSALFTLTWELQNDIYFQIGLVTLVGLSAKNAILMVEFAMQRIKSGTPLLCATIEGAKIRFRPIIMTSLAFIAGTLPLALSNGAGANSRHILGTTIVGGMVTLTLIGIVFVPFFFYFIMRMKEKFYSKGGFNEA